MAVVAPTPAAPAPSTQPAAAAATIGKDQFSAALAELLWGAGADPFPLQPVIKNRKEDPERARREAEMHKKQFFALACAMQTNPLGHSGLPGVVVVNRKPLIPV